MAGGEDTGNKTHRATPRRRRDARKKGKVALSEEVGSAAVLLVATLVLWVYGSHIWETLFSICRESLTELAREDLTVAAASGLLTDTLLSVVGMIAPVLMGMTAVALLVTLGQTGFHISMEPLTPNFAHFNPAEGAKKLVSLRSIATLAVSTLKLIALLLVAYVTVRGHLPRIFGLHGATAPNIAATMSRATLDLGIRAAMLLMVIAAMDYAYQKWQYEKDLRMTRQEVKDEEKLLEGSPETKRRIRTAQLTIARRRMLSDVKKADVVVRNPTHYAVALKYDSAKATAPVVLAKGMNYLAQRIVEIARKHRIPTVRDAPLAQALHKSVEVGGQIPAKLYRAVAKLLVHIYRLRGRKPETKMRSQNDKR